MGLDDSLGCPGVRPDEMVHDRARGACGPSFYLGRGRPLAADRGLWSKPRP